MQQVKMRSYWIRVDPNSITCVLRRREKLGTQKENVKTHMENATERRKQRLEGYIYKPRNVKDCWQQPEARTEARYRFSLRASTRHQPC